MILAVDVGNTQTVVGLLAEGRVQARWRIHTDSHLTEDELRVKVAGLLGLASHSWGDIDGVVIASVVPILTDAWTVLAEHAIGSLPMIVGPGLKTGLPIHYDNPLEIGADRVVNAIAAIEAHGAPVIVVDFGTATTIDVVDADGAYAGGAIAPGVETSAEALFSRAARLAKVDLEAPDRVIGTNTRAAVQSGLLFGEAAMVDGLVRRSWDELGVQTPVVATGGLAERMAPLCETVGHVDGDLTLTGLRIVYERNR